VEEVPKKSAPISNELAKLTDDLKDVNHSVKE